MHEGPRGLAPRLEDLEHGFGSSGGGGACGSQGAGTQVRRSRN